MTLQQRVASYVYYLFLIELAFLPSGNIGTIPVKSITLIILLGTAIPIIYNCLYSVKINRYLLGYVVSSVVLALWIPLSASQGFELRSAVTEYSRFFLAPLMLLITVIYLQKEIINQKFTLSLIVIATSLYLLIKLSIYLMDSLSLVEFVEIMPLLDELFAIHLVSFPLLDGSRIFLPNDMLISISVVVVGYWYLNNYNSKLCQSITILFFSCAILGVFISYSRFFWLQLIVALLIVAYWAYYTNISKINAVHIGMAGGVILTVGISISGNYAIGDVLFQRFHSHNVSDADMSRWDQLQNIWDYFTLHPIWGTGWGSYPIDNPVGRDGFSYDLQILSLLYKTGIIGMSIFVLGQTMLVIFLLNKCDENFCRFTIFIGFMLLFFSGLINPNYFTSVVAVSFVVLYIFSQQKSIWNVRNNE